MEAVSTPKLWHSRGYLPHIDQPGLVQMITFRLADSIPGERFRILQTQLRHVNEVERRKLIERHLDAGFGCCWLGDPRIALIMEETLLHFDGERYRLIAWVVMPNHVHVLIETFADFSLSKNCHSWKGFTANQINKLLERSGQVWMPEYFDRYVRDDEHLHAAVNYIHLNPVKAGLCTAPEQWRWSSAWEER